MTPAGPVGPRFGQAGNRAAGGAAGEDGDDDEDYDDEDGGDLLTRASSLMRKSMSTPALDWLASPPLGGAKASLLSTYEELEDDSDDEDGDGSI